MIYLIKFAWLSRIFLKCDILVISDESTMHKERDQDFEQQLEEKKLQSLIEKYRDRLGGFDLVRVENAGYILQSQRQKPMAGGDWIFFDLDDTLIAYSAAKGDRLQQYTDYLLETGIELSEAQAEKILKLTDAFSRWEEDSRTGKLYHANSHMLALQWATQLLGGSSNYDETIALIELELARMKGSLSEPNDSKATDPFTLSSETRKLSLNGLQHLWSKKIESIFMGTTVNPSSYDVVLQAGIAAGTPNDSIHRTNAGVFTYGDPYFQLLKTFELLEKNPDLALSQIWLSKIPKGAFIVETAKQGATQAFPQDYVPTELEEYPGEGISYGSGYVLGNAHHTILMVDDDPRQLDSILESNAHLEKHTGAQFMGIRSKQPNTKMLHREWQVTTTHGELDFTSTSFSPSDIQAVFLINLLISRRSRLGDDHADVAKLKKRLNELGVVEV